MKFLTIWRMPTAAIFPGTHPARLFFSIALFFYRGVEGGGGGESGGPRKSPRDYGLSLLRPPAANPKEANAMKRASR